MTGWKIKNRTAAVIVFFCAAGVQGQQTATPQAGNTPSSTVQPAATFRAATRMVAVEVVARDHKGQPVAGLTADDFQVSEQIAGKREQHPQKIAAFRAVNVAEIAAQDRGKVTQPAGVYSNFVTFGQSPSPANGLARGRPQHRPRFADGSASSNDPHAGFDTGRCAGGGISTWPTIDDHSELHQRSQASESRSAENIFSRNG